MLNRASALVVTVLVTGALLPSVSATAVGETCQGRQATLVGSGPDIRGTAGDDVIVTGTSAAAYGEAGDDLICVTPSSSSDVLVDAGAGDDVVDVSVSTAPRTITRLGTGVDRYVGGAGHDEVDGNGADDHVEGADEVILEITEPATGLFGTYAGSFISVWSAQFDVEVELDEQVVIGGVPAADIADFRGAAVHAPRVVLRGNSGANNLSSRGCHSRLEGGGGDDYLDAVAYDEDGAAPQFDCAPEAQVSGGPGDDTVLGAGGADRLMGDSGDDTLRGRVGSDSLSGGTGDDNLKGGSGRDEIVGNGGNDALGGDEGNDVLIGSQGRDRANGQQGRDRCVAELERSCER